MTADPRRSLAPAPIVRVDVGTVQDCAPDEHRPDPDGTHCLRCGILAEPAPLSADALFLLMADSQRDRYGEWWRMEIARDDATRGRAHRIARAQLTADELATAAALAGIVADPDALPLNTLHEPAREAIRTAYDPTTRDEAHRAARTIEAARRMHETVSVYGDWRAQAINARAWAVWDDTFDPTDATIRGSLVTWRAWPGDTAADYDASAERFELSPSGRWHGAARPSPYADEPVR